MGALVDDNIRKAQRDGDRRRIALEMARCIELPAPTHEGKRRFTTRHYIELARVLRVCQSDHVIVVMARMLKLDNPAFDEKRFAEACGL